MELLDAQTSFNMLPSQREMWLLSQNPERSKACNLTAVYNIDGNIDVSDFQNAVIALIKRHESLRSIFFIEDYEFRQMTCDINEIELDFDFTDLTQVSVTDLLIEKSVDEISSIEFNLGKGPMLRIRLIRLQSNKYLLIFVIHHIAADGYSLGIFINDLFGLYNKLKLPDLSISYRDYINEHDLFLTSQYITSKAEYWLQTLEKLPERLNLPYDFARPKLQTFNGAQVVFELSREKTNEIKQLITSEKSTILVFFLAVFKIFLSKISGQNEFIVGVPLAGRTPKNNQLIGMFVNTVAVKSKVGNLSFKAYLSYLTKLVIDVYRNRNFSTDQLYDELNIVRDLSRNVFFDVMLVVHENFRHFDFGQLKVSYRHPNKKTCRYDLVLHAINDNGVYQLALEYNTNLFKQETIKRFSVFIQHIITSLLINPESPIDSIDLLNLSGRNELIQKFSSSKIIYPKDSTIVDLINQQSNKTPNTVAVVCNNRSITYEELNNRSTRLSQILMQQGITTNTLVPICVDRNLETIVGILAILKAGGCFVPIESSLPKDRIHYILQDTEAKVVLCYQYNKSLLFENTNIKIILLDERLIHEGYDCHYNFDIAEERTSNNLAYVIYTSGSTGRPKGVMVKDQALIDHIYGIVDRAELKSCKSFGVVASLGADAGHSLLFSSLTIGGIVHFLSEELLTDREALAVYLKEIDCIKIVPSLWLSYCQSDMQDTEIPVPQKTIIFGGESFNSAILDYLIKAGFQGDIYNHYGPTETTIGKLIHKVDLKVQYNNVPIGVPFSNTRVYILSKQMTLCPIGIPGQIFIGGDGLALGYLNLPELTQEKFILDPISNNLQDKLYATGDIGRWLADGNIEYLGREDDQIKIRGYRIELAEIESVINQSGLISHALVVTQEDRTGEKRIVAYVVPLKAFNKENILLYLKSKLPEYMIPTYIVTIDTIPLSVNGKVDRRALPDLTQNELLQDHYTPPGNITEEKLAEIWIELLGISRVGIHDNFYELGGHSLKTIRLAGFIHKTFNVKISISDLFANPTLWQQAQIIDVAHKTNYTPIPQISWQEYYDLSASQRRLWLIDQIGINKKAYNVYGRFKLNTIVDVALFKKCVHQIITKHEMLRTVFVTIDSTPKQKILDATNLSFDIKTVLAEDELGKIYDHVFELNEWPLFKLFLVEEQGHHELLYLFHHIITDGWSMQVFFDDLLNSYKSLSENKQSYLPELTIQYKDYSAWQNKLLSNGDLNNQRDYWLSQFDGQLPQLILPIDYELGTESLNNIETSAFECYLTENERQAIYQYITKEKVSLFGFFIACFKVLLNKLTGAKDIIIGTPVANRDHHDIKDVIGFFLNTLMLRNKINDNQLFGLFLNQVNQTLFNGLENQAYPFEELLDKLNIKRNFHEFPISPIFLNLLNFDFKEQKVLGKRAVKHIPATHPTKFNLECYIEEFTDGIAIYCNYKTNLFKPDTIEYWMNGFLSIIRQVIENPSITINDLVVFPISPASILLPEIRNDYSYFKSENINQSIVARFNEQVKKYPNRTAIQQDDISVTYEALAERTNQIAADIKAKCKSVDTNIALLLTHGNKAITGIFGVLKSGNVYVPLDPSVPQARLQYMLMDTGCNIILVDSETVDLAKGISSEQQNLIIINIDKIGNSAYPLITSDISPQSPAYILYTSGSTGEPKGVIQSHRNVLHFIRIYTNNLKIGSNDKLSLLPNYCFDSAVMDIFGALLNGATLCAYDIKKQGLGNLANWIVENKISIIHTVPTVYRHFITELAQINQKLETVRLVVLGGEAVYKLDFDNFKKYFSPESILINGYGPTESTITLQNFLDQNSDVSRRNVTIGYPVSETTVYLLDENDNVIAEAYQLGELVYKSDYLALGYWNKQEQTNRVFTTDPVTKQGRVYRSGDYGRLLPSGAIEFVGRKDSQIKLQGQRIELVEVEEALRSYAFISDCLVVLKESNELDKKLVAYYTASESISTLQIRKYLLQKIPPNFVPSLFIRLDEIPRTASGKSNRKYLESLPIDNLIQRQFVAPQTKLELALAAIWKELLSVEKVSLLDDFFSLGGSSLIAIKAISVIRTRLAIDLTIMDFINQSLSSIALKFEQSYLP